MPTRPLFPGTFFEQPLDGVVRIGALVEARRVAGRPRRPLHHERPFRREPAADVLEHEDVAVFRQRLQVVLESFSAVPIPYGVRSMMKGRGSRDGPWA